MFKKILIANRGEIACRILRTAHRLGIECIAVHSEADTQALHVRLADEAFCIGAAPSQESYLRGDIIIKTALRCGAEAIHPGYGFLSENATFAENCTNAGLNFIGPSAKTIRAMGLKSTAKKIVAEAGVPLILGYHDEAQDLKTLHTAAKKIGYPILLKAAAGGGGKGMRVVWHDNEFTHALASAKREALASFGDDTMLIEKYLTKPRHVEVQLFADKHGHYVYLFERDCSIQRRHQKIIEEAPAPHIDDKLRTKMGETAIAVARAIDYVGAGTIEFLLDENGKFYFMEMNTRLQVEHPVTEMITGQDLVEWQFKIALGEPLPLKQKELKIYGHAFETRIYAEDPYQDFLPSIGTLKFIKTPQETNTVRIDSGIAQGDSVTPYYDPMLAKLIVWGDNRENALQQLTQALSDYQIVGVTTNLDLLTAVAKNSAFAAADIDTGFIEKQKNILIIQPAINHSILAIAALYLLLKQKQQTEQAAQQSFDPYSPWHIADAWRVNLTGQQMLYFLHGESEIDIRVFYHTDHYFLKFSDLELSVSGELQDDHELTATLNNLQVKATVFSDQEKIYLLSEGQRYQITFLSDKITRTVQETHDHKARLTAPMPGKIVALLVTAGTEVDRGEGLAVIEAMKMEHTIHAPTKGIVKEWYFKIGESVEEGAVLLDFESIEEHIPCHYLVK